MLAYRGYDKHFIIPKYKNEIIMNIVSLFVEYCTIIEEREVFFSQGIWIQKCGYEICLYLIGWFDGEI